MKNFAGDLSAIDTGLVKNAMALCSDGRKRHATVLERLHRTYIVMSFLVDRRGVTSAPSGVQILFGKIVEGTEAVRCLLFNGFPGPAGSVVRSMFEAAVHLHLMMEKSEEVIARAQLFTDFIHVERHARLRTSSAISDAEKLKNAAAFEAVKSEFGGMDAWHWKVLGLRTKKGDPRAANLRDLCQHLGREKDYASVYGHLSAIIHPVPSYEMWMRNEETRNMEVGPKFNEHVEVAGNLALCFGAEVGIRLIRFLRSDDADDLVALVATATGFKEGQGDA